MNIANRFKKSIANNKLWKTVAGQGTILTKNEIKNIVPCSINETRFTINFKHTHTIS